VTLAVREAVAGDAPAIHELLTALGRPAARPPSPRQRAVLTEHVAAPGCTLLVAERRGAVVGFACLWIRSRLGWDTPEAWIPDLAVAEDARRTGVARELLAACEHLAVTAGCHLLRLECGHHRTAAHALYRDLGFDDAGTSYQLHPGGA